MRRFNILASVILLCFMTACNKIKITLPQDNLPDDKELVRKATEGDEDAAFEIGKMYVNGVGVKADYDVAVQIFEQLAKNDDPYVKYFLGVCYGEGLGKQKDADKASQLYKEAFEQIKPIAEKGDANAQLLLSRMYDNGCYVESNTEGAVKWYRLAAKQGIEPAILCLKELGVEY